MPNPLWEQARAVSHGPEKPPVIARSAAVPGLDPGTRSPDSEAPNCLAPVAVIQTGWSTPQTRTYQRSPVDDGGAGRGHDSGRSHMEFAIYGVCGAAGR